MIKTLLLFCFFSLSLSLFAQNTEHYFISGYQQPTVLLHPGDSFSVTVIIRKTSGKPPLMIAGKALVIAATTYQLQKIVKKPVAKNGHGNTSMVSVLSAAGLGITSAVSDVVLQPAHRKVKAQLIYRLTDKDQNRLGYDQTEKVAIKRKLRTLALHGSNCTNNDLRLEVDPVENSIITVEVFRTTQRTQLVAMSSMMSTSGNYDPANPDKENSDDTPSDDEEELSDEEKEDLKKREEERKQQEQYDRELEEVIVIADPKDPPVGGDDVGTGDLPDGHPIDFDPADIEEHGDDSTPHDDDTSPGEDPCTKAKDKKTKVEALSKHSSFTNAVNKIKAASGDNKEHGFTFIKNSNGTIGTSQMFNGTSNSLPVTHVPNEIAGIHYHPEAKPQSPGDVYTLYNNYKKNPNFTTEYVVTPGGDVYAIVITDPKALASFVKKYPPDQVSSTLSPEFGGEAGEKQRDLWGYYASEIGDQKANELSTAYILNSFNSGVALMKQDTDGTFKTLTTNVIEDADGTKKYTLANCPE